MAIPVLRSTNGIVVSSVATVATQTNNTVTLATITGQTFTLHAGQSCEVHANLICASSSTLTGLTYGISVTTLAGANANVIGSVQILVAVNGNYGGGAFNVPAATTTAVTAGSGSSVATNNVSTLTAILKNLSTNTNATVNIQFASKTAGTTFTVNIGSAMRAHLFS